MIEQRIFSIRVLPFRISFVLSLIMKSLIYLQFKSDPLRFSVNSSEDLVLFVYTRLNLLLVSTIGANLKCILISETKLGEKRNYIWIQCSKDQFLVKSLYRREAFGLFCSLQPSSP